MEAMILLSRWREIELICEIWRPIAHRTGYEVSSLGRIRSFRRAVGVKGLQGVIVSALVATPRLLSPNSGGRAYGYAHVSLPRESGGKRRRYVATHRIVAEAFLTQPDGCGEVNHLTGLRTDPRLGNLQWVTRSQNQQHAIKHLDKAKKLPRGELHHGARFKERTIRDIRYLHGELGWSQRRISELCGVRASEVSRIVRRVTWAETD